MSNETNGAHNLYRLHPWSILKLNFTFRSFPLGHLVVSLPSRKSALFIGKGIRNRRIINSLKLLWLIL